MIAATGGPVGEPEREILEERYFQHVREHPQISARDVHIIGGRIPAARWVVDVGCGSGGFLDVARQHGIDALGLDVSPAASRLCRRNGLPILLADADALPFASGSLDVVRAKEIIEHLADPSPFIREVRRVLRPDGLFLVHVPSQFSILYPIANFYDDYTHYRPLSRFGLRRLLEDTDLQVLFIRGYTAGRNPLERALGRLLGLLFPHTWCAMASPTAPMDRQDPSRLTPGADRDAS